jgi:hypothetical protein
MPEIATFGKRFCFYFYKTWEKAKEQEARRLSSYHVNSRACLPACL